MKALFIILVLLSSAYSVALNALRRRSASRPIPENVSDVYDSETYAKWRSYCGEHCTLDLVSELVSCFIMVLLLLTDAFAAFCSLFGDTAVLQILAVTLLTTAISTVTSTVFGYIRTMKIEQKYGFNKTTLKTFVFDRIRSVILDLVLTFGLACFIASCHILFGDIMIVVFAALIFAVTLLISFLYPLFSRISNKFTPLPEGELRDKLTALLDKHGYKVKEIEVMDASRRTTKLNAYFTGFGKLKRIVLYDNLVEAMSTDEICAVFAHELGHGLHRDVLKSQIFNIVNLLVIALVTWVAVREPSFYTAFGYAGLNYGFAYILVSVMLGVTSPLLGILINAHSRAAEYRADKQAVTEGYGAAMVTALKKLARENFAHLSPSKINVIMEYSHPPLSERISAIGLDVRIAASYRSIGMDEAEQIMSSESNRVILDVRRPDEFSEGHIPGAINVPNEEIGTADIPELPDKAQLILVYCRSGRRSKEASAKLAGQGYTNIVEFGGILDWKGEIEK